MSSADFPIRTVSDVLTHEETRIFGRCRLGATKPSAISPTEDLDLNRLIFEVARREITLSLVAPQLGPDILYWWGEFRPTDSAHNDHDHLIDGAAVTLIIAASDQTQLNIRLGAPGLHSSRIALQSGAALVLPAQSKWAIEQSSNRNAKVMVLSFAAPAASLRGQGSSPSIIQAIEVSGDCRSACIPLASTPYRGARNAFALPAAALSFDAPEPGSPAHILLDGHTDVLNSLRVWTSAGDQRDGLPPYAESLSIPLRSGSAPTYRAAGQAETSAATEAHVGLSWTAPPLHIMDVRSSGPLIVGGEPSSTTYLRSFSTERLTLHRGDRWSGGLSAADRVLVLQSGEVLFNGEVMCAPGLGLSPAGAAAQIEVMSPAVDALILNFTGLVAGLQPEASRTDKDNGSVVVCIPLIARRLARDWEMVCHLLDATLRSIYAQTDPRWRVVVVGTDPPVLTTPVDERFEFVSTTYDLADASLRAQRVDASFKRRVAERYARARGATFVFFCDSDDLLSSELVQAILSANHPYGCILGRGYVLDLGERRLAPLPLTYDVHSLDEQCASCAAFNVAAAPDIIGSEIDRDGHIRYRERMYRSGRPMLDLPFRAATYVRFATTNMSDLREAQVGVETTPGQQLREAIAREALPITPEVIEHFALATLLRERSTDVTFAPRRLSVIICTHGRPDGLGRLLDGLMPQILAHPDRELIVVNDGTHDQQYADILAPFTGGLRYEPLPRSLGIAAARNRSAELARGDYLVFTDDDCEVPAHWLDWLDATLVAQTELDVVAGTTLPPAKRGGGLVGEVQESFDLLPRPHSLGGLDQSFVTACLAVRRQAFQAVGGFNQDAPFDVAGEDTDLSLRLIRAGARCRIDPDWQVFHALATSVMSEIRRYRRYGWANAHLGKRPDAPIASRQLSTMSWRHLPKRFFQHLVEARTRKPDLSGGFARRLAACLIAAAIQTSYDWGAVFGARELRR